MDSNILARIGHGMVARVTGPMKFRLVLQPGMALFLGIKEGLKDAREGKPPYFWALFTDPAERDSMLNEGWKSICRVFILGVVMDVIYQLIEVRYIHILMALLVATILAILPYLFIRGPVNRIARREHKIVKQRTAGN